MLVWTKISRSEDSVGSYVLHFAQPFLSSYIWKSVERILVIRFDNYNRIYITLGKTPSCREIVA